MTTEIKQVWLADTEIIIDIEEYRQLKNAQRFLKILDSNGVDNWEGYDDCIDLYQEDPLGST